jgi:hypothetical protein
MKKIMLLAALLAAFAAAAQARIITYTWNQTSASYPGLAFTAYYQVEQSSLPHSANSGQTSPDFGGLVGLYIEGGGYPIITLSDLIPSCYGDCGGAHNDGYPSWTVHVPYLSYVDAISFSEEPFHFEWSYLATATSIQVNDDNANKPCFDYQACMATGYWTPDYVPEPWTVFAFVGGLAMLGLTLLRRPNY